MSQFPWDSPGLCQPIISNSPPFTLKNVPVWAINYMLALITEDRGTFLDYIATQFSFI